MFAGLVCATCANKHTNIRTSAYKIHSYEQMSSVLYSYSSIQWPGPCLCTQIYTWRPVTIICVKTAYLHGKQGFCINCSHIMILYVNYSCVSVFFQSQAKHLNWTLFFCPPLRQQDGLMDKETARASINVSDHTFKTLNKTPNFETAAFSNFTAVNNWHIHFETV